jgi:hypothetical protein
MVAQKSNVLAERFGMQGKGISYDGEGLVVEVHELT